jgi:uncharacterized membrane protein
MTWLALVLSTALFVGLHLVPFAPAQRDRLAHAVGGANTYKVLYAVGSLVGLFGAFFAAARAPVVVLWTPGDALRWLAVVVTLPAFVLVASAYVGAGGQRLARHPMLAGIGLWALVHALANGTLAHVFLFGALAAYAPVAMVASDRRLAGRDPAAFATAKRETSLVPFAKFAGKGGLSWKGPLAGLAAWIVFLLLHGWLFGVSPLPAGLR